jgi:hypothetical protein
MCRFSLYDGGCESASNCNPRSNCRKPLTDKLFAGNWWGHDWTPITSLKNDRFLHSTKYLESDWSGVKVGRRFTPDLSTSCVSRVRGHIPFSGYLAYDGLRRTPRKSRVGNLKETFGKESADFHRVDKIAHAFKHVVSHGKEKIRATEVISRPPGRAGVARAGLSRAGDPDGGVTLANDVSVDLVPVLKRAVEFLRRQNKTGQT